MRSKFRLKFPRVFCNCQRGRLVTAGMQVFLDAFAATIAKDAHVAPVVDGAGWHSSKTLNVPSNITLVALPPYCPELNPVERVWLRALPFVAPPQ
jgi:transposase